MKTILLGIILSVLVVAGGYFGYQYWQENEFGQLVKIPDFGIDEEVENTGADVSAPVACTADAKLCPDGSAVGRTGPNCEFAQCPAGSMLYGDDVYTDWKTYSSSQYGFEFKYPSDWQYQIVNEKDIDDIVQLFSPESWIEAQKGDKDGVTNFMAFRIWKTDVYIEDIQGKNVNISGKSAIDTGWSSSGIGGLPVRTIRFLVDPPVTIEMNAVSDTKSIEEQILGSFKFNQ